MMYNVKLSRLKALIFTTEWRDGDQTSERGGLSGGIGWLVCGFCILFSAKKYESKKINIFSHTVITLLFLLPFALFCQSFPYSSIEVTEDGKTLLSPYTGGLNQPQFSQIHLNNDTLLDLFVFERSTSEILCFYAERNGAGKIRYQYAPDLAVSFPKNLKDWVILADYNCDDLPDLFTASFGFGGISVFKNTGTLGAPSYQLVEPSLFDVQNNQPVYADKRDLAAFVDVDEDGDLDILAFESGGFSVNWFRNRAIEDSGRCGPLAFTLEDACWGKFQEDGLTNAVTLNVACKRGGPKHAGSTVCVIDEDGDSKKDVLIGDLNFNNLVFLHNNGTLTDALMDRSVFNYPGSAPTSIHIFPSAFWLDVDLDGRKDLLATSNAPNIGANYDQVWLYRNTGTGPAVNWDFTEKDFLLNEMIEVGSYSKPVFFDENGDGLLDLLIGNYLYRNNRAVTQTAFTLYHNTGTASNPVFDLSDRNYLDISTLIGPTDSDVAPTLVDIDNDQDLDLVIGTFSGKLFFYQNNAFANGQSNFVYTPTLFQNIDIGQHAMPTFGDIDNDGDQDLVIGENGGTLNLFLNTGDAQNPVFADNPDDNFWGGIDVRFGNLSGYSSPDLIPNRQGGWDVIVGTESGFLMRYQVRTNGGFPTLDSIYGSIHLGVRATPAITDLNGDGIAEIAVGGRRGGVALFESNLTVGVSDDIAFEKTTWRIGTHNGTAQFLPPSSSWGSAEVQVIDIQGRKIHQWKLNEGGLLALPALHLTGIVYISIIPKNGKPQTLKYTSL